jgi:hypothetical protein
VALKSTSKVTVRDRRASTGPLGLRTAVPVSAKLQPSASAGLAPPPRSSACTGTVHAAASAAHAGSAVPVTSRRSSVTFTWLALTAMPLR